MKKILYIFMMATFFSCAVKKEMNLNQNLSLDNRHYIFSDNVKRNLEISFVNDSIVRISNTIIKDHAPSFYLYVFNNTYKYKYNLDLNQVIFVESNKDNKYLHDNKYIKPFRKKNFEKIGDVFFNPIKDTIFIKHDFTEIQIKEFNFKLYEK